MARNRKRANRRPTRPRPPGPGGAVSGANGRADVEAQEPQNTELELGAVDADVDADADEPELDESELAEPAPSADGGPEAADQEPDSGLAPIDFAATNIQPLDLGLDTGLTPEFDIAAGAERAAADERLAEQEAAAEHGRAAEDSGGELVADDEEYSDEEYSDEEDEDVEEFLDEHPEDAADTELYEDATDVEDDADTDYDEDGEPDDDGRETALATAPSARRRRPPREKRPAPVQTASVVAHPRTSLPARLIGFLQGSWRELQRVQWPDRRQVMQATGVVVGFVIVAGVFLGVADYLSTKLINFILG